MRWGRCFLILLAGCAAACAAVRADEIHLKDGTKVVGTIVGYEKETFRVETAYGYAMIHKSSIAEIIPDDTTNVKSKGGDAAANKSASGPSTAAAPKPGTKPAAKTAGPASDAAGNASSSDKGSATVRPGNQASLEPAQPAPLIGSPIASLPTPAPAAQPLAPKAAPLPVREEVGYNLYSNQTYGFSMYKPPSWDLLRDARSAMPEAITALGTSDGSTILVIARDTRGGALDARAADTAQKLQNVYDHYRPLGSRQANVGGVPAIEQRFRGSADGHDWSVIVVTLERGNEVFTILGMTYADSDLIQLQENVIAKSIGSLQFTNIHP